MIEGCSNDSRRISNIWCLCSTLYKFQYSSNFSDISWGKRFCSPNTWMPSIFHTIKRRIEMTQRRRDIMDTIGLKAGLITRESLFFLQFDQLTRIHSLFRFECNSALLLFSFDIQLVILQCQQFYKFRTNIRKRERSKTMKLASSVYNTIRYIFTSTSENNICDA